MVKNKLLLLSKAGIYIMQNTMVMGEGNGQLGEKNEKGERKKEENYIKKGEKVLKVHFFGL